MTDDFGKLPDAVKGDWLDKFYHDVYRGHLNQLSSFLAMGRLATLINEARAADRQEIADLRAKLATYEEREKQGAVEFNEWCDNYGFDNEQNNYYRKQGWDVARVGWLPANECVRLPALEWPEGMNEYAVSGGFREHAKVERYMSSELCVIKRPTAQPTPAQIRAEMLAKLDKEYQRIEAEMSRIEAMTDAEVLAQKDGE